MSRSPARNTGRAARRTRAMTRAGWSSSSTASFEEAAPHRLGDGRGAVRHAELLVQALEMPLDRGGGEVQALADIWSAVAFGDERKDLLLACDSAARATRPRVRISWAIPAWISGASTVSPRATAAIVSQTRSRSASLERYASAPAATASYAMAPSRNALSRTAFTGDCSRRSAASTCSPSRSGSLRSSTTTSGRVRGSGRARHVRSGASPTRSKSGRSRIVALRASRNSG